MKKEKPGKILIMVIIFLLIVLLPTIVEAGVESKPGTTTWTNISVSDAYGVCYGMASGGSTLGNCSLDPHLALNKDWGATAYLAISGYGAVTTLRGPTVAINGKTGYYTTTGNITGVIDFGRTLTYTSSAIESYIKDNTIIEDMKDLINNKNSKYVELLPHNATIENTKGMAILETKGWFDTSSSSSVYDYPTSETPCGPIMLRAGNSRLFKPTQNNR